MAQAVHVELDPPDELGELRLPLAVDRRLQNLQDRQDQGDLLASEERAEAEGLVDLAEFLSWLYLRTRRGEPSAADGSAIHTAPADGCIGA